MTPTQFSHWLEQMKASGLAKSDAECARRLGITPRHILNNKRNGASKQTALACAALLKCIEPFGG